MKAARKRRRKSSESGVALLIALFVLLIISVVAIALIVASGSESSLSGNYRSSAAAYLAGTAGLEEARGRLLVSNADYVNKAGTVYVPAAAPNFVPPNNAPLALGQVRYILNPGPGETAATLLATYPDTEYNTEFTPLTLAAANVVSTASVSTVVSNGTTVYGPLFKWVRITPATEQSIGTDVDHNGALDNNAPLYFDSGHLPNASLIVPPMVGGVPNPPATAKQVFEITTLAVLPNGTQKLMQSVVAPFSLPLTFPAALTLAGNTVGFIGANSNQYYMNGQDGQGNPPAVAGCTPNSGTKSAIGVTGATNVTNVTSALPRPTHYLGAGGTPSVVDVSASLNTNLSTPAALDKMVQTISASADLVIAGSATNSNMPAAMSATNPMTVVVDGDFTMSGNYTGYGLLVVTGNLTYSGNTGWNGIVLVVGKGTTTFQGNGGGNNSFNGAIYAATTKNAAGVELATLGTVNFDISGGGGNGVNYNSCWINQANQVTSYQIQSFRELH